MLGGLVKFRVTGEDNSRSYRLARVAPIPEPLDAQKTAALTKQRERLETLLYAISDRLAVGQPPSGMPDETLVDLLSQDLPRGGSSVSACSSRMTPSRAPRRWSICCRRW